MSRAEPKILQLELWLEPARFGLITKGLFSLAHKIKLLCNQVPAVYLAKQLNLYRSPLPTKKQFQTPLSLLFIILGINNFAHHIPHAIKYRSKNRHPLFARACKRNLNWTNTLCCQVCVCVSGTAEGPKIEREGGQY